MFAPPSCHVFGGCWKPWLVALCVSSVVPFRPRKRSKAASFLLVTPRSSLVSRLCSYPPPVNPSNVIRNISGLGLVSTGSVWSPARPDDSGPANATSCDFERNTATDGGGIYSTGGYDFIRRCRFEENLAGGNI